MAQLYSLPAVIYPSEINIKCGLYDAEDDGYRIRFPVIRIELAHNPIQDVERAVGTEGQEVEAVDYGGDGCLSEQEELREDADGLEDYGEDPE